MQTTLSIYAEDFALTCPHCEAVFEELHISRLWELHDLECGSCFERCSLSIVLEAGVS